MGVSVRPSGCDESADEARVDGFGDGPPRCGSRSEMLPWDECELERFRDGYGGANSDVGVGTEPLRGAVEVG